MAIALGRPTLRRAVTTVVGYLLLQEIGLWMAFPPVGVGAYWPAAGWGIAAVGWATGRSVPWLCALIFATNLSGNLAHGNPVALSLGFALANTAEAAIGGLIVRRAGDTPTAASAQRWLARVLLPAAFLATAVGAVLGTAALLLAGLRAGAAPGAWWVWYSSDLLGVLTVLPAAHAVRLLSRGPRPVVRVRRLAEGAVLTAAQTTLVALVFHARSAEVRDGQWPYLVLPGLFWAVVRFGPHLTALMSALLTTMVIQGTSSGAGPFTSADPVGARVLAAQTFCAVVFTTALVVAHVIATREAAERAMHLRARQAVEARNRELERSNRELEEFAYIASHDLQEPVRNIITYCDLLAERCADRLDERSTEHLKGLAESGRRMRAMIADLLIYARAGTVPPAWQPVDTAAVVTAVLEDLRVQLREAGAQVDTAGLPTLTASPNLLRQALQNLISNAVKFRGPRPPRVRVSAERECDQWVFTVDDNGIGVDPRFAEQIFQMFRRLHGYQAYPGSGIGLAVVRRLVERGGGRVWCEPRPGPGARFRFTIPDTPPQWTDNPEWTDQPAERAYALSATGTTTPDQPKE